MKKHEMQRNRIISLTERLINEMDAWPDTMKEGIDLMVDACCAEIYMRASALVFQSMAAMTAAKESADPEDVEVSRALLKASKRSIAILSDHSFRALALRGDGTIN